MTPPPPQQDACRYLISDLCVELESYLPAHEITEVYRAYLFGAEAHEGQSRKSGEPYIFHPLAVARILSELRMDYNCLVAAILHDVIEDTPTVKEQLRELFGAEVAELVDGVSKMTHLESGSRAEKQAESFRKMLLAMSKDIRVILIKLADRLHNMRTLGAMPSASRQRIARETLEIYAPIATRLGINEMRIELEDLSFAACWPLRYRILSEAVIRDQRQRSELIGKVRNSLINRLQEEGLLAQVEGREKHLYGIYRKMRKKTKDLKEGKARKTIKVIKDVMDVFAFRVVVDQIDQCYRALGVVHNLYLPVPGKFKDYIAIPKPNGYQSLHTVLKGPNGLPLEIQIRTEKMDRVAENGLAAHWKYKEEGEGEAGARLHVGDWLKSLLDLDQGVGNSIEFLEHVKVDLFTDEVYIFTPGNEIKVLAKGSTVIDFAYAVHSDVGNRCVAARVNQRMVPLRTCLFSGQTVEVITKQDARPDPAWLNFVVTARARAAIRAYLKSLHHQEAVELGQRMVNRELEPLHLNLQQIAPERLAQLIQEWRLSSNEQLFSEIALGNRAPMLAAHFLAGAETAAIALASGGTSGVPLIIQRGEGMVVSFARCCHPIPGDAILASFNPGKGIVVHRKECRNISDPSKQGERWLEVAWSAQPEGEFSCELTIDVENRKGVLATIAAVIAELESNIENVLVEERDGRLVTLRFLILVKDRIQVARIIRRLRHHPSVIRLQRKNP